MIRVDRRRGSGELLPYFPPGTASIANLEYADFSFVGNGPGNVPWQVGIERKTIGDLVDCIKSGRFTGHQLTGLLNGYNEVYLVVEGLFKADKSGVLCEYKGGKWQPFGHGRACYMMRDIWLFLNTIAITTGVRWSVCCSMQDTANFVATLHRWWTFKDYSEHRAHLQPETGRVASFGHFSLVRRLASHLSGIGWEKSKLIEDRFDSVEQMVAASETTWQEVDGIGKKLSVSIVQELKGEAT